MKRASDDLIVAIQYDVGPWSTIGKYSMKQLWDDYDAGKIELAQRRVREDNQSMTVLYRIPRKTIRESKPYFSQAQAVV